MHDRLAVVGIGPVEPPGGRNVALGVRQRLVRHDQRAAIEFNGANERSFNRYRLLARLDCGGFDACRREANGVGCAQGLQLRNSIRRVLRFKPPLARQIVFSLKPHPRTDGVGENQHFAIVLATHLVGGYPYVLPKSQAIEMEAVHIDGHHLESILEIGRRRIDLDAILPHIVLVIGRDYIRDSIRPFSTPKRTFRCSQHGPPAAVLSAEHHHDEFRFARGHRVETCAFRKRKPAGGVGPSHRNILQFVLGTGDIRVNTKRTFISTIRLIKTPVPQTVGRTGITPIDDALNIRLTARKFLVKIGVCRSLADAETRVGAGEVEPPAGGSSEKRLHGKRTFARDGKDLAFHGRERRLHAGAGPYGHGIRTMRHPHAILNVIGRHRRMVVLCRLKTIHVMLHGDEFRLARCSPTHRTAWQNRRSAIRHDGSLVVIHDGPGLKRTDIDHASHAGTCTADAQTSGDRGHRNRLVGYRTENAAVQVGSARNGTDRHGRYAVRAPNHRRPRHVDRCVDGRARVGEDELRSGCPGGDCSGEAGVVAAQRDRGGLSLVAGDRNIATA